MRISGGALKFSHLVRLMRRPELVQRLEVATAGFEHVCGCGKEEDEEGNKGEMRETHVPIYRGANTRHARNRGG